MGGGAALHWQGFPIVDIRNRAAFAVYETAFSTHFGDIADT